MKSAALAVASVEVEFVAEELSFSTWMRVLRRTRLETKMRRLGVRNKRHQTCRMTMTSRGDHRSCKILRIKFGVNSSQILYMKILTAFTPVPDNPSNVSHNYNMR